MPLLKWDFIASVLVSGAFLAFGAITYYSDGFTLWNGLGLVLGVLFLVIAYFVFPVRALLRGGDGGSALALGENSNAEGGDGGKGIKGQGGRGGNAIAQGARARAKGGAGGSA